MTNIFDLFRDKKSSVDAREAQTRLQWQSSAAAGTDILRQSVPVFEEYEKELQQRGITARLIRIGPSGLQLKYR